MRVRLLRAIGLDCAHDFSVCLCAVACVCLCFEASSLNFKGLAPPCQVPPDSNDCAVVLEALGRAEGAEGVVAVLAPIRGPFAFAFWQVRASFPPCVRFPCCGRGKVLLCPPTYCMCVCVSACPCGACLLCAVAGVNGLFVVWAGPRGQAQLAHTPGGLVAGLMLRLHTRPAYTGYITARPSVESKCVCACASACVCARVRVCVCHFCVHFCVRVSVLV